MNSLAYTLGVTNGKLKSVIQPVGLWQQQSTSDKKNQWKPKVSKEKLSKISELLKKRKLRVIKCEVCEITSWQGVPITEILEIYHINGDKNHNSVNNLRLICPNCHGHTLTRFEKFNRNLINCPDIKSAKTINLVEKLSDVPSLEKKLLEQSGKKFIKHKIPLESILAGEQPNYKATRILDRLLATKQKEANCEACLIKTWRDLPIGPFLECHHLNHNSKDHKLSNLAVYCRNCHELEHVSWLNKEEGVIDLVNTSSKNKVKKMLAEFINANPELSMAEAYKLRPFSIGKNSFKKLLKVMNLWKPQG